MPEGRIGADLREQVSVRANSCCEYCRSQARYATQAFSIEHILPRVQGGATSLDNLALACQGCNNHKYDTRHLIPSAVSLCPCTTRVATAGTRTSPGATILR